MKRVCLLLTFLVIVLNSCLFGAFSKQQAIDLVLNTIVKKDIGKINVYVKDNLMEKPDSLYQEKGVPLPLAYAGNWVFFIDDLPNQLWYHDCRYCFVSNDTGEYTLKTGDFYPSDVYADFLCISTVPSPELPDISYDPPTDPGVDTREINPHLFAVIICGDEVGVNQAGWADDHCFWNTTSGYYCTLKDKGFSEDNIHVLYANGFGPEGRMWLDGNMLHSDIDAACNLTNIRSTFGVIQDHLTIHDRLVVIVLGHGNRDFVSNAYIYLPGIDDPADPNHPNRFYDTQLAAYCHDIQCADMFFSINSCFSGGFVDNMINDTQAECTHRAINTIASHNESAAGESWMTQAPELVDGFIVMQSQYIEFPLYWIAAAHGIYPKLTPHYTNHVHDYNILEAWNQYGAHKIGDMPFGTFASFDNNLAIFPQTHDNNPDYNTEKYDGNNDGKMQLHEIFRYANNFDTYTNDTAITYQYTATESHTGYYNPYGVYVDDPWWPTEHPQEGYSDPMMGYMMTLRGLAGNLQLQNSPLNLTGSWVISDKLTAVAGTVVNIAPNSSITMLRNASLVIAAGAILNIGSGSTIYGEGDQPAIIVEGTVNFGTGVTFQRIDNGHGIGLELHDATNTAIQGVHFVYSDLVNDNTYVDMADCTFNHAVLSHSNKSLEVHSSSFDFTYIKAVQTINHASDHVHILDSQFTNASKTAISATGFEVVKIARNIIFQNQGGIELYHCMGGFIDSNSISYNTNGIYLYSSKIDILGTNEISYNSNQHGTSFGNGVNVARNSLWKMVGDDQNPNMIQTIHNNQREQVLFQSNSAPVEMTFNEIYSVSHDYPYLRMWDAYDGPRIDISNNYWSEDFDPRRDIDPLEYFIFEPIWVPGIAGQVLEDAAMALYDQAIIAEGNQDYVVAEALLKEIIAEYPDTKTCPEAAKELLYLVGEYNQNYQALEVYYKTYPELRDNPTICRLADYLANFCNIKEGDYEEAITFFEDIILNPEDLPDSIFAVVDAGYTYLLLADNSDKSAFTGKLAWLKPKSLESYLDNRDRLLSDLYGGKTDNPSVEVPIIFGLDQNYPNPFNPSTTISYSIPKEAKVAINIYNIKGQLVKTLFNGNQEKGTHRLVWNGKNDNSKQASSGLYLIRIDYMGRSITRKALMLK